MENLDTSSKHGGDVILTYRSQAEEAKSVVAEIEALGRKAVALQLDVGDTSALRPLLRQSVRPCSLLGIAPLSIIW
jgi:NAD(P)-dependent dehydrogenase (short-subunit alcohol dehydrogenase family)